MKTLKLITAGLLLLVPTASSAGLVGEVLCGLVPCSDSPPPVPEPSGALVMGIALLTVAVARRKMRK